jgi:hypothetical protein
MGQIRAVCGKIFEQFAICKTKKSQNKIIVCKLHRFDGSSSI